MMNSPVSNPTVEMNQTAALMAGVTLSTPSVANGVSPTEFAYTTTSLGRPVFQLEDVPTNEADWVNAILVQLPPCSVMERFCLIEGTSQYGALNHFTYCLAKALTQRGHQCKIVNVVDNPTLIEELTEVIQGYKPTVVLGFNGANETITLQDAIPMGQFLNIPAISWFVDHPLIHMSRIELQNYTQKINAYAVVDGMESALHRVLANDNVSMNVPLRIGAYPDFDAMQPFTERDNRILVPSSFTPFMLKRSELHDPEFPELEALCLEAVDYLIASPEHPVDALLMNGLEAMGLQLHDIHPTQWQHLYTAIHHSAEMYWREHLLKAARNLPLRLFGRGWEAADFISDKWEVHDIANPAHPFEASRISSWYGSSQTVWNIFPAYPATGHDRIFFATANGCNIITEKKEWLYGAYGETLSYLPQELSHVEENLRTILEQPIEERAKQAKTAQKRTLEAFSFFNCVGDIEALLQKFRLREVLSIPKVYKQK
jgi:hypothetical protein